MYLDAQDGGFSSVVLLINTIPHIRIRNSSKLSVMINWTLYFRIHVQILCDLHPDLHCCKLMDLFSYKNLGSRSLPKKYFNIFGSKSGIKQN